MSASTHHSYLCPADRRRGSASPGPHDGPDRLRSLIRRIADDDRDAFAELFDRTSGPVLSGLLGQVPDRNRVAGILAGTFVEVWRLAAFHVDPDTDVLAWIGEIVLRRVADIRPVAPPPGSSSPGLLWTQHVEVELAGLLRRHPPP